MAHGEIQTVVHADVLLVLLRVEDSAYVTNPLLALVALHPALLVNLVVLALLDLFFMCRFSILISL